MTTTTTITHAIPKIYNFRSFSAAATPRRPPRATPVTWASLAICVALGTGLVSFYQSEKERRETESTIGSQTKTIGKAAIGGPWSLFNTNGRLVTDADYRGKFQFVYFGFTRCPDICPNELVKIGKIFDTLNSKPELKGEIKPLFISIDPRRDTIDQLKIYSQDFHPEFDWLTGTPEQVNAVAKAYRVYWSKVDVTTDEDDDDEYSVDHTIVTYLMGPDGDFVDLFTSGVDSNQVIERITNHVVKWKEEHPVELVEEDK
jgi:protein SCO1/2